MPKFVKWTPFVRASLPKMSEEEVRQRAREMNVPYEAYIARLKEIEDAQTIYMNSRYQVNITPVPKNNPELPDVLHLSIKRRDKQPIHDWRDLQRIKNELVGAECEAMEIYPAESRLVDTANQYHLWCFRDPYYRIQLGFDMRYVKGESAGGAVQRPFEPMD